MINGQLVVENGEIPGLDINALVTRHNEISSALLEKAHRASTSSANLNMI
jgi:hypothetical protein